MPKTTVWVHFEEIPMEYFEEEVLYYLGNQLGRLIKVDRSIIAATRGQFLRICVEIDLNQPLQVSLGINFPGCPLCSTPSLRL